MADMERLVSGLSAHLDKVEQAAKRELDEHPVPVSGKPCPECGGEWRHIVGRDVHRFAPCGHVVPDAWWGPQWAHDQLGLVGASRDLITQWRREASHHASEAQRRASYARFPPAELDVERRKGRIAGLEAALVVVARGWGVDTDDEEDGGG